MIVLENTWINHQKHLFFSHIFTFCKTNTIVLEIFTHIHYSDGHICSKGKMKCILGSKNIQVDKLSVTGTGPGWDRCKHGHIHA